MTVPDGLAALEAALTDVLRLVMADEVDAHDSLFSAGGTSLHAEIFSRAASEATGRSITFTDVFQHPSPAAMARALWEEDGDARLLQPASSSDPAKWRPVSENQAARLHRLRLSEVTGTPVFRSAVEIVGAGLELTGALDVPALESAVAETVSSITALRTVFDWRSDHFRQRIAPALFGLEHLPAEDLTEEDVVETAQRPFTLDSGRLGRFVLATIEPERHQLWIVMEHIVSDAVSWDVVAGTLARSYARIVAGEAGGPADAGESDARQGFEYAALEDSWCRSAPGLDAERHWLAQIGDGPVWRAFEHPELAPASDPLGGDVLLVHAADRAAGLRLSAAAARLGTTAHALTVFALARAVAVATGVPDATVYWYTANRTLPGVATTVGSLAGVTMVRIEPVPEGRGDDDVRRVAATIARSMASATYPLERVARVHRSDDWVLPDDRAVVVLHVNPEPADPAGPAARDLGVFAWPGLEVRAVPTQRRRRERGYTIDASTRFVDDTFLIGLSSRADMLPPRAAGELLTAFATELLALTLDPEGLS